MGFKKEGQVAEPPIGADASVTPPAGFVPPTEYPATPAPTPGEFKMDLNALVGQSDKDLRIMFSGIYQAVIQSGPLYASAVVRDLNHWHELVEKEVDYLIGRVLARSRKS